MKEGLYLCGPNDTPRNGIYTGDATQLSRFIPDESVDLIFTDPPYSTKSLHLYQWLAQETIRVLKPGGFILAMCGGLNLDKIYAMFAAIPGLRYYWQYNIHLAGSKAAVVWPGGNKHVPIVTRTRAVLAYSKGKAYSRCATLDLVQGTTADKRYHIWGQEERTTRYYIDCFSEVGDLVWDPFCGGGTTVAMCKLIDRRWLAFESDPRVTEIARDRVENIIAPLLALQAEQLALDMMTMTNLP